MATQATGRRQLNIRIPDDLHTALCAHANGTSQTLNKIVLDGIRDQLGISTTGPVGAEAVADAIDELRETDRNHAERLLRLERLAESQGAM